MKYVPENRAAEVWGKRSQENQKRYSYRLLYQFRENYETNPFLYPAYTLEGICVGVSFKPQQSFTLFGLWMTFREKRLNKMFSSYFLYSYQ